MLKEKWIMWEMNKKNNIENLHGKRIPVKITEPLNMVEKLKSKSKWIMENVT